MPKAVSRTSPLLLSLKPDQVIYATLRHKSDSGMSRSVDFYSASGGNIYWLSGVIAESLMMRLDQKHGGIIVRGTGFDAAQHVLSQLSAELFDGPCVLRYSWL